MLYLLIVTELKTFDKIVKICSVLRLTFILNGSHIFICRVYSDVHITFCCYTLLF
jgi:hypothetical protein